MKSTLPVIAIVGKPNVGKSSLFNRLIRQRKAIVSEEPGVTRDINYETTSYQGFSLKLADTAGYTRAKSNIHQLTRALNERLIAEADIIILTCDTEGLSGEDYELAEVVRRSGKPVILVVNKVDNEERLRLIYEFFDMGFGEPIPVSALHGKNIEELKERIIYLIQDFSEKQMAGRGEAITSMEKSSHAQISLHHGVSAEGNRVERWVSVAIVGRPNVGKSSLLNLLVNKPRAIVTETPGTTRDTIDETLEYNEHIIKFMDTAGLRKRSKVKENIEFYSLLRAQRAIEHSDLAILVLDACDGITQQDKKIAAIIVEKRRGLIIAANKWDIAKGLYESTGSFIKNLYFDFPHVSFADIIPVSAKTGYNKIKLLKNIINVYNNYNKKVKTSDLNIFIRELSTYRDDIKYAFQRDTAPPCFEFFVKKSEERNNNLRKYLQNSLRVAYDLRGVPVVVNLRAK
ncbi:MAG: ribosome biogenesis GTPase Der [Spirochaetota bacterium]